MIADCRCQRSLHGLARFVLFAAFAIVATTVGAFNVSATTFARHLRRSKAHNELFVMIDSEAYYGLKGRRICRMKRWQTELTST